MKKPFLFLIISALSFAAKAQSKYTELPDPQSVEIKEPVDSLKHNTEFILDQTITEEKNIAPSYPGGIENFYKYLGQNIHYPKEAIKNHIQGRVLLTFEIERDGYVTSAKVIGGVSEDIDAEAVRVVNSSPKWNPGMQNNRPVRVQYTVPIDFKLPK